jgi:uncharacterized protein (DUF983 family)
MCADSECSFFRNKSYLIGKKFTCPDCGSDYLADSYKLRVAIPKCDNCVKSKQRVVASGVAAMLKDLSPTESLIKKTEEILERKKIS